MGNACKKTPDLDLDNSHQEPEAISATHISNPQKFFLGRLSYHPA